MYPGGHMIWIGLGWAIALAVIYVGVWLLLTVLTHLSGPSEKSPEEVLKRRLAAGEIDVEEYGKRMAALSKTKRAA